MKSEQSPAGASSAVSSRVLARLPETETQPSTGCCRITLHSFLTSSYISLLSPSPHLSAQSSIRTRLPCPACPLLHSNDKSGSISFNRKSCHNVIKTDFDHCQHRIVLLKRPMLATWHQCWVSTSMLVWSIVSQAGSAWEYQCVSCRLSKWLVKSPFILDRQPMLHSTVSLQKLNNIVSEYSGKSFQQQFNVLCLKMFHDIIVQIEINWSWTQSYYTYLRSL